jgi:predicted lipoprotein with Yx(FWY)xxD motif
MEDQMNQLKLHTVTRIGVFFFILALALAACSPYSAATSAPAANSNPIPVTGANALQQPGDKSLLSGAASATVMLSSTPSLGNFLVDSKGMTLYLFTKDTSGVSNCNGGCLKAWPPLLAQGNLVAGPGVTGKLGEITRSDGAKQVTYDGMPLYYWASDVKPGDTTGQGVGGVWFIVPPTKPTSNSGGSRSGY